MKNTTKACRSDELQRLIDEQTHDMSAMICYPETITPLRPVVLSCLTNKEKAVIILSIIGAMKNVDIGEALNVNESSIRGILKRAKRKLQQEFKS